MDISHVRFGFISRLPTYLRPSTYVNYNLLQLESDIITRYQPWRYVLYVSLFCNLNSQLFQSSSSRRYFLVSGEPSYWVLRPSFSIIQSWSKQLARQILSANVQYEVSDSRMPCDHAVVVPFERQCCRFELWTLFSSDEDLLFVTSLISHRKLNLR